METQVADTTETPPAVEQIVHTYATFKTMLYENLPGSIPITDAMKLILKKLDSLEELLIEKNS